MKSVRMLLLASLCAAFAAPTWALERTGSGHGQAEPAQLQQDAPQQDIVKAVDAALAGEYSLNGVMETGSGLLLRGDGSFEWYFSYGALDLGARGNWSRAGDAVELVVVDMGYPDQLPETKFERMQLRIDDGDLVPKWPWDMDAFSKGGERGRYVRN